MKNPIVIILLVVITSACTEQRGERLFDMVYPNTRFIIPAGLSSTLPRVFEERIASNIQFYLSDNMVDTAQIQAIRPVSATLFALENDDYDFVREISVRVCPDTQEPCTIADEVFYIDDILNRAGDEVRLLPTLKNARPILLEERYKLEIVFFLGFISPVSVESQFDMIFEAVE